MSWFIDEEVALKNNKVLRQVSKATLSDRLKSLVNKLITENDNIIAKSEKDREEMAQYYISQEEQAAINKVLEEESLDNKETLSKLGKLK